MRKMNIQVMEDGRWGSGLIFAVLSLILVLFIGSIDYLTGYDINISYLYLLPIFLAAWFSWRYAALSIAISIGFADELMNFIALEPRSAIDMWNAAVKIIFYVTSVYVLLALKAALEGEKKLSGEDPLTGLVNSRRFYEIGNAEIQRSLRYRHPFSIAYMDIDDFKSVNDSLGHHAGDEFLRAIAEKMKNTVRRNDTIARLGGDEFAVLFPETGADSVKAAVGRLRDGLLNMKMPDKGPMVFSIGVITDAGRPCAFDDIIKASDRLMYESKRSGKNMVKYAVFGKN